MGWHNFEIVTMLQKQLIPWMFWNLVDQKALTGIWGKYSTEVDSILMKAYPANEEAAFLFETKAKHHL